MSKIGILGTGTWGTALGRMLANTGHSVVMWSAIEKEIDDLSSGFAGYDDSSADSVHKKHRGRL
mgnify:CR=1 FL=1